jgi:hypothetical protein
MEDSMDYNKPDLSFLYTEVLPEEAAELGFYNKTKFLAYDLATDKPFIIPKGPAIYKWYFANDKNKQAVYIGKASCLRTRTWQHWCMKDGAGQFLDYMFDLLDQVIDYDLGAPVVDAWFCEKSELDINEATMICQEKPLWNQIAINNKTQFLDLAISSDFLSGFEKYQCA